MSLLNFMILIFNIAKFNKNFALPNIFKFKALILVILKIQRTTTFPYIFVLSHYGSSYVLPVLRSVNYDNTSVPLAFSGLPVDVHFALKIAHLANFDSKNMDYSIDLEVQMIWFDSRLMNNYTKWIRIWEKSILDRIWKPDPYFVNSKHSHFHHVSFPNFRMLISPQAHKNLWFRKNNFYFSVPSSCLSVTFKLERNGARFIVEKYIPSALAVFFAWIAPFVPYNYEEVRIITPISVLLTLVQMERGEEHIHISYVTSIDVWFRAMKVFTVLSLLESVAVLALIRATRVMEKRRLKAANEFDRESFRTKERHLIRFSQRLDHITQLTTPLLFATFLMYYILIVVYGKNSDCKNS
ncbi:unnamed protein product [Thelazia callipaeda]|uniref:Neur_chan_LBD domain-containing protein n=1 Tax=Thelazia callipaeda TaxID=103827 RepID=A0A0N5CPR3_THECL|nr:unnamed protein product [Thelazia callipaeda]